MFFTHEEKSLIELMIIEEKKHYNNLSKRDSMVHTRLAHEARIQARDLSYRKIKILEKIKNIMG